MRKRLAILSLAMVLAIGSVLAPFSRAAYANTVAIEAGAYALFTVLGLFGFNAGDDAISDPVTAWNEFTGWMDDLSADVVDEARAAARASNPDFINNALDWDAGGKEAIEAQFLDWGEQGAINLDGLSIMAQSGALGLLPFILSLYMADQGVSGTTPSDAVGNISAGGMSLPISVTGNDLSFGTIEAAPGVKNVGVRALKGGQYVGVMGFSGSDSAVGIVLHFRDGKCYLNVLTGTTYLDGRPYSVTSNFAWFGTNHTANEQWWSGGISAFYTNQVSDLVFSKGCFIRVYDGPVEVGTYLTSTGLWYGNDGVWTDNPDVIGGSDYWDDAKENKDILNPAAGAAVIGADAVFDGDYIKNRGSIGVFSPADYADINSWADALARAHAGVAQGTLDGTISNTTTGTAVDVGTGELVTDTVGELTKPDGGHSTSKPKDPNGRDPNDWKIPIDLSKYFPFCIPFDIIALFEKLGSGASAFSFEPFDAPAFDAPFKVDGVIDENIHLDFADWSGMMANIRMLEFFVFLVGLAMVTRNIIRG